MKNFLKGIRTKKNWHLQALIVLEGGPNVGKSHTLIELSKMLVDESLVYVEEKGTAESFDRRIFLRTTRRWIGIGTAGDTPDCIKKNLLFFKRMKCDIGIMASRLSLTSSWMPYVKLKKILHVKLRKPDVKSKRERTVMELLCAGIIRDALGQSTMKTMIEKIEKSDRLLEVLR